MKLNKDVVQNQLTDSQILDIVTCLVNGLHPTHIAISPPFDTTAAMTANGSTPSPRTAEAHIQKWCDTIHNAGVGVLFRGTYCGMESIYNFPFNNARANVGISGGGVVNSLTLTRGGGQGGVPYTTPPAVVFDNSGSGGSGAAATASIASGTVTGLTITNGGSGYTSAPSVIIATPPTGTAASAATDGTATWLGKVNQFIRNNPTFFRTGDIFAPFPEQTTYIFANQSFISGAGAGYQANYAQFFNDLITVANAAFAAISVTGVITGLTSNNYSEVGTGWLPGSIFSNAQACVVDYYGNYNNDGYDPSAYNTDFFNAYNSTGQKVFQQEWADLNNSGASEAARIAYVDAYYRMITHRVAIGKFKGFSYWGGWDGAVESIVYLDVNGKYKLNGRGKILSRYFNGSGLRGYPLPDANGNF